VTFYLLEIASWGSEMFIDLKTPIGINGIIIFQPTIKRDPEL
jgi:hypothetical protein